MSEPTEQGRSAEVFYPHTEEGVVAATNDAVARHAHAIVRTSARASDQQGRTGGESLTLHTDPQNPRARLKITPQGYGADGRRFDVSPTWKLHYTDRASPDQGLYLAGVDPNNQYVKKVLDGAPAVIPTAQTAHPGPEACGTLIEALQHGRPERPLGAVGRLLTMVGSLVQPPRS
jgi:hypothetical protein